MLEIAAKLDPWVLLMLCAMVGTAIAYLQKYAWAKPKPASMRLYLFGDTQAVTRVVVKLVFAVGGALLFDMPANMATDAVFALGIGIGLAIPEQIASEEIKRMNERRAADQIAQSEIPFKEGAAKT